MAENGYEQGRSYGETIITRLHEVKRSQWRTFQGLVYAQVGIVVLLSIVSVWLAFSSESTIIIGGPDQRVVKDLRLAHHDSTKAEDHGAVRLKPPPSIMSATGDQRMYEGFLGFGNIITAKELPQPVAIPSPLLDDELGIPEGNSSSIPSYSLTLGKDTGIYISVEDLNANIEINEPKPEPKVFEPQPPQGLVVVMPVSEYPWTARERKQWGVVRLKVLVDTNGMAMEFEADVPRRGRPDKTDRKMVKFVVVEERPKDFFFADKAGNYVFDHWVFIPARDTLGMYVVDTAIAIVYFRLPTPQPPWWDQYLLQDSVKPRL